MKNEYVRILNAGTILIVTAAIIGCHETRSSSGRFIIMLFLLAGIICIACYIKELCNGGKENETRYAADGTKQDAKEKQEQESEFLALQSQINPHFLYNTLDSIRGQALIDGAEEIADMTEALSAFFRFSISRRDNMVMLSEELHNVENYMKIQQFRFEDKFVLEKKLNCTPETLQMQVPKMILQPLVENAIFHGVEPMEEQGIITIRVDETDKKVRIVVEDNGVGMPEETLERLNEKLQNPEAESKTAGTHGHGIALVNVNHRIQLCFGKEYGLFVRSMQGVGTQMEVLIAKESGKTKE